MAKKTVAAKKRNVKVDAMGQFHVHSSFNNIIVCLANSEGQVISWSSAGKMGFRGSKKNTPYAAQMAAQDCAKVAYDLGLRKVKAYVKGPGNGRESAIRTIAGAGIEVNKSKGLGTHGHIAIKTKNIDRASAYLERCGVKLNWDSAKKGADGALVAVYLEEEIGGFAVHLVQAK